MADYTVIAEIGEWMIKLLQKNLVPEVLENPDEIGLRSPGERGDVSLGIFLYDIRESEEVFHMQQVAIGNKMKKPPLCLSLFYMMTAYFDGDIKYRLLQEEKILGKVLQTFHGHSVILANEVCKDGSSKAHMQIQLLPVSLDEKAKVWNGSNTEHRLSLFYRVSPVMIDTDGGQMISRITDVQIQVHNGVERKR